MMKWRGWEQKAKNYLAEYERLKPNHNFTTFAAVERLWQEVIAPRLPEFISMQEKWEGQEDIPSEFPWKKNKGIRY